MANLNFPSNPTVGQTYTIGNRTWVWNGYGWQIQSGVTSFDPLTANRVIVTTSTNATGTNSGGLIVYGGAGIGLDLYVGGDIIGGRNITATNNVVILGTASSTSTTTGALTIAGGVGVYGSLYAGALYDQNSRVITEGTLGTYGVTAIIAGTDTAINTSTGAVTISNTSTLQTVTGRGNSTTNAIGILNLTQSNSTYSGAFVVAGGVGIGGNLYVNNTGSIENIVGGTGYIRDLTVNSEIINGVFTSTSIVNSTGTATGSVIIAGGVGIAQDVYIGGILTANTLSSNVLTVTSGTIADLTVTNTLIVSNTGTNAVYVAGDVTVAKSLYAGALYDSNRRVITTVIPTSDPYIGIGNLNSSGTTVTFSLTNLGVQTLTAGTDTYVSASTGTILIYSTATLQSITNRSTVTSNALLFSNTTESISTTSGALVISGGLGVGGNLYGTALFDQGSRVVTQATLGTFGVTLLTAGTDTAVSTATGNVVVWNTSTFDSITQRGSLTNQVITFANPLDSNTSTQGSVVVTGGMGVGRNLIVGGSAAVYGNLQVFGTQTYIDSTVSYVTDPIIEMGGGPSATPILVNDGFDRGLVWHYSTTATSNLAYTNNAFFGMDNATKTLIFKTNVLPGAPYLPNTNGFDSLGNYGAAKFGNLSLSNFVQSANTLTGTLVVAGGIGAGGNLNISGDITAGPNVGLSGSFPTITITDTVTGIGPALTHPAFVLNFQDDGFNSRFKLLTTGSVTSFLIDNIPRLQITTATTYIYSTAKAFSTTTGALQVTGGAGIQGDLYAQTMYSNGSLVLTQANIGAQGVTALYAGTDTAVNTNTGVVTIWNTSTLASITSRGNTTTSNVFFGANIESTASNTGSVVVVGGLGVSGNIYAGAVYDNNSRVITLETAVLHVVKRLEAGPDISVNTSYGIVVISGTGTFQTVTERGSSTNIAISITNTASSTASFSGALVVDGGVGIKKSLNVGKQLTVGNNFNGTLERSSLDVWNTASYAFVQSWYSSDDVFDFRNTSGDWYFGSANNAGLYLGANSPLYIRNGTSTNFIGINTSTPIAWLDVAGDIRGYNIFSNGDAVLTTATIGSYGVTKITTGTGITINPPSGTGQVQIGSIDTLQNVTDRNNTTTNAIVINSYVTATSTASGALIVAGGVGIAGALYVGGNLTSAGVVTGAILNTGTMVVYGTSTFASVVASTSPQTGAITVGGGVGVGGDIFVGGKQTVQSTVLSTSTSSGALQVRGGVGIAGGMYIGTDSYVNNSLILTTATVDLYATKTSILAGTDTAVNTSTGIVTIWNTSTLQSVTSRGNSTNNAISITNTTVSTSTTTGALKISGGIGVADSVYVGNKVGFVGTTKASRVYQYYNAATDSLDTVFE